MGMKPSAWDMIRRLFISRLIVLALAALSFAGCHSAARTPPASRETIESAAAGILKGYDPLLPEIKSRAGAEALYQVDIFRNDIPETTFLHIRLVDDALDGVKRIHVNPDEHVQIEPTDRIYRDPDQPVGELKPRHWHFKITPQRKGPAEGPPKKYTFHSKPALARVALYDVHGHLEKARYLLLPESCLRRGFYLPELFGLSDIKAEELTPDLQDKIYPALIDTHAGLQMLTSIVISTPLLQPIVSEFIPFFVKLSAIFGGLTLSMNIESALPCGDPIDGISADYTQNAAMTCFILRANDSEIIRAKLTAIRPDSPLDVCAGVLQMEGQSTADPTRRFRIRLVAARRPTTSLPTALARMPE